MLFILREQSFTFVLHVEDDIVVTEDITTSLCRNKESRDTMGNEVADDSDDHGDRY